MTDVLHVLYSIGYVKTAHLVVMISKNKNQINIRDNTTRVPALSSRVCLLRNERCLGGERGERERRQSRRKKRGGGARERERGPGESGRKILD